MRYKLNIQGFAGPIHYDITVNGEDFTITRTRDDINTTWEIEQNANSTLYSINNSKVIWQNGGILQYNGVDVLPTDLINAGSAYTTRAVEPNYVTWKFNDTISFSADIDFYINFVVNNFIYYFRLSTTSGTPDGYIMTYTQSNGDRLDVYNDTDHWINSDNQIIQVDSNSRDYKKFVTWAKANGGVLLEKGTYKWVDTLTFVGTVDVRATFNFISNNTNYEMLDVHSTKGGSMYYDQYTVYVSDWVDNAYKTITTATDQYVDYDFYNYAITGGQLVKQAATPTTGTIKFGTAAPTKYYLGNKAVDRIYMGTVLLYKKAIVYTITANLANCTANSDNPITIEENGGAILYYTANEGYELPDGIELTNVGSYNWDKATGKLVIARPSGNVTIKIVAKQTMTQLATPQNVAVENTTLSFDEVENAEEYEVFVDNVSIGSYQVPKIKVYGITGLGESSPTLTRTDDNVGLTQASQELHDFFVANEDVTDSNGNHFVQLKKFFVKILGTDYVTGYQVSHTKIDDSYILCPMFYDKDGNEIDYAYYGKYKGYVASNKLYSQSGKTPTYSTTIDNFMTYARNNGSNEYYAIDWATAFTAQIMFMIVYANTKYDAFFTCRGYGSMTGDGGTTSTFLGIEDMVGNGHEMLINVSKLSGSNRFYYKDYIGDWTSGAITSGNYFDGRSENSGYQSKHLYNTDKPIVTMFPSELNGSETTFYCDYYIYLKYGRLLYWGNIRDSDGGLFYLYNDPKWNETNTSIGSRLCAKKLI